jgi:hypothetical protein
MRITDVASTGAVGLPAKAWRRPSGGGGFVWIASLSLAMTAFLLAACSALGCAAPIVTIA